MQSSSGRSDRAFSPPFKPYRTILEQEVAQAEEELERPAPGLFLSGLVAGFGVSISALLAAYMLGTQGDVPPSLGSELLMASTYAVGFILVIMGHTDLFTEYTTLAILPVLVGRARVIDLLRLWGLVLSANLLGAAAFALVAVGLGKGLDIAEAEVFARLALDLVAFPAWIILLSAGLTGWMMGLLSWLLSAARDTTSQILFIWIVAGIIGVLHLHHSVTGTAGVLAGVLSSPTVTLAHFGHFLLWATAGNIAGSIVFAVLIRYSVVIGKSASGQGSNRTAAPDRGPRHDPPAEPR